MISDASEMLAAALEQMDGIIAGSKAMDYSNGLFDCQSPTSPFLGSLRALHLLEDLRGALDLMDVEERESLRGQVPATTAECLVEWLQSRLTNGHGSGAGDGVYQEQLSRLESEKECLVLQVSVLTDQVEVQGEKIKDLEMCLEEHRMKLIATEELLQQELLSRSSLETQKLELLTEVSSLKLKLATVDRENRESEGLYQELSDMHLRIAAMEAEKAQQERSLNLTRDELMALQRLLEEREQELRRLKDWTVPEVMTSDTAHLGEKDTEVQRMKQTVKSLMATNVEKDHKIEELQQSLMNYKPVLDMAGSGQRQKAVCDLPCLTSMSAPLSDKAKEAAGLCGGSAMATVLTEAPSLEETLETDEPQVIPCAELVPEFELPTKREGEHVPNPAPHSSFEGLGWEGSSSPVNREELQSGKNGSFPGPSPSPPHPGESDRFGTRKNRSSFSRGFFKIRGGKSSSSTPNLAAEAEQKRNEHLDLAGALSPKPKEEETTSPEGKKKAKGIRRFLGMMRKSQSTSFNLEDAPESEFRRGGVRATAGPRLGWSHDLQCRTKNELDFPLTHWSKDQVCVWLQEQGLGLYVSQVQQWISSGSMHLNASPHDLEKELGIRHPLHRKKLQLALQTLGSEEDDTMGKLDFNWVTRWLDDIGLPQYKSQFEEGRVDGRMLHYMTVDNLLALKVGSVLHHFSIKRAIQVLRINRYDPSCLRRRPSDESNITPAEVCQWTNHRVMEWLRSVDLAEYAPNLRGSGVHGGLMVLEPRFNVETMALLLNIPPSKTLLRRHLATHFHLLIGAEEQGLKQECLENPDYMPLTATARVKPRRLSFGGFGTLRRKRQEEIEEYVCPMDVQMPQGSSFHTRQHIYRNDLDQLKQMEDSEGTVRQIGAFSEGISNLTSMLTEDELFREMPSHSPNANTADESSA
ncbi:liprin-beta-1 isoform X1 [Electrophorus electricus]|uniref:liprin-beta-1 isoform X1 n=1 Tax=Electrophorus electricus TaxID=8005 RepID=UPI0015D07B16|nr:liprin-beta-1 isoform X1 [Electrophorus electricus]